MSVQGTPNQNQLPLEYGQALLTLVRATSLQNNTLNWFLVIGVNAAASFAVDGNQLQVEDSTNNVVDSVILTHIGTAASEMYLYLPKKLLIPPGGWLRANQSATIWCQYISFPDLKALQGFI
jgi:hypothetical protein